MRGVLIEALLMNFTNRRPVMALDEDQLKYASEKGDGFAEGKPRFISRVGLKWEVGLAGRRNSTYSADQRVTRDNPRQVGRWFVPLLSRGRNSGLG